jgi:uncharacterized membrane protein YphA (DoxX/SURF4 family)
VSEEFIGAAALTGRYVLALVFLAAAIPKLAARRDFERAVSNYRLLPGPLVGVVASWLPRFEILCSLALLLGVAVTPVAALLAFVLLGFSIAIAINLSRGRRLACGCFSNIAPRTIGWSHVVGDLGLAALAVVVAVADPGVLTVVGSGAANAPALTSGDGVAAFTLATLLVLGFLLVTALVSLRSTTHAFRAEERPA